MILQAVWQRGEVRLDQAFNSRPQAAGHP